MKSEILIRGVFFLTIFFVMGIWELMAPKRRLTVSKSLRWLNNLGIILIDTATVRTLTLFGAVGVALAAEKSGWGVLNYYNVPFLPSLVLGVFLLDLVIYLQHLMFHAVPLLWRLHMVHHADMDIDVTTGLRFHPIEIIISMFIKMAAVAVLGPPFLAVIIFDVILNGTAMFNHSNVSMPSTVDSLLRLLVVTPDMHRVHHSVTIRETNSNFGFNFPWWDRIFGTYRAQPAAGHENMIIGLSQFRNERRLTLPWLLILPFIGDPGAYSINKSGMEPTGQRPKKGNGE